MATLRFTQAAVDRLKPPASGRVEYWDELLPAFGLRIAESGRRTWQLMYRLDGKQRRLKLADVGGASPTNLEAARTLARDALQQVQTGIDPAAEKQQAKGEAATQRQPDTVASVVPEFVKRYLAPKNKSWRETEKLLNRHIVATWGERDITSISRRDVRDMLDGLVDRGFPIAANRTLATGRKLFNWAIEREITTTNPFAGVHAPGKETQRDRVLSDDELVKVWRAAEQAGGICGAFFRLLILLGQRREEIATMRWCDLDLDTRTWTLPRESTKADRAHEVPLPPLSIEVLTALPRFGTYVFSTTRGDKPISGFSKLKARIVQSAGFGDWRVHDLRRTAATGMARLGVPSSTISKILNHAEGGVTRIYNRYAYDNEKRIALETWAQKVESLVKG